MTDAPVLPPDAAAVPQRPTTVRWLILALACGTSMMLYLHRYTWNFIAPQLISEYRWSLEDVQATYSLFNWTYGFGQIPGGMLCDLIGPHVFLGAIIILWSLLTPLHSLPSATGIALARLGHGAAQAGCYPSLARVTRTWFPASYRTIIQGIVATFFGRGGGVLAPILMATVLMAGCGLSWQRSLVVLSALGIVFGVVFLWLFRDSPEVDRRVNDAERRHIHEGAPAVAAAGPGNSNRGASSHEAAARPRMPWGRALRNPSLWFIALMQLLVAGVDTIYSSLMGVYFLSKGITLAKAGLLSSLPLAGGMLGGLVAATANDWLLSRMSRRRGRSIVGGLSNLLAAGAMLIMIRQETALAAGLGLMTVKFFADMSQPCGWGACTDLGGRNFSATVFAIMNTGGNLGGILLPLVYGVILSHSRTIAVVEGTEQKDFVPLLTVAAGLYIASGVCWMFVDCTKSLEPAESALPARTEEVP